MNSVDVIRSELMKLYRKNPRVHINISTAHPKVNLKNEPFIITGVYPHIFQLEEQNSIAPKRYTFQYTDVMLHYVEIVELGKSKSC